MTKAVANRKRRKREEKPLLLQPGDLVKSIQSKEGIGLVSDNRSLQGYIDIHFPEQYVNFGGLRRQDWRKWFKLVGHIDPAPRPIPAEYEWRSNGVRHDVVCVGIAVRDFSTVKRTEMVIFHFVSSEHLLLISLDEWCQPTWDRQLGFIHPFIQVKGSER